ncbi:DNA primase [Mycoplasmopsis mucosicanis]|uniref:DNA primase n=1 Tax=Mycoplasmopsis mucosicanis TaxID=458208 RepID=A0A507SI67_9BACT|nr:DNA primase [Mycoplasmopsis mucosicanis]TQC51407.1 DNA primase [Mycoplasmopsis mucosicanis]
MSTNLRNIHDELIAKLDIVEQINKYVTLTKKGQSYVCLCPFHDDSNPSMNVSPSKRIFKCFVCGEGGDVVRFVSKFQKISYPQALKMLADQSGIAYSSNTFYEPKSNYSELDLQVIDLLERVNSFYKLEFIKLKNSLLYDFFTSRQLNNELLSLFDIGYASKDSFLEFFGDEIKQNALIFAKAGLIHADSKQPIFANRITFAIRNSEGKVVGFSARTLNKDEKPKYINSAESTIFQKSEILYNFQQANQNIVDHELIIVEGFFDVIALAKIKRLNAVALMGTALTLKHLKLLKNKNIILFLDGDNAGQKASLASAKFLLSKGIDVRIVANKTRLDPDEIIKELGIEYLQNMLANAPAALDFVYDYFKTQYSLISGSNNDLNSIQHFVACINEYIQYSSPTVQSYYKSKVNSDFKYTPDFDQNHSKTSEFDLSVNDEYFGFEDTNTFLAHDFVPDYIPPEPLDINAPNFSEKPYKIAQHSQNKNKLSWIDLLFYLILDHPDLYDLFIQRQQKVNEKMSLNVFNDYKHSIMNQMMQGNLNNNQKQDIRQTLTHNDEQLTKIYENYRQNFGRGSNDSNSIYEDFEFVYNKARIEADEEYINDTKQPFNKEMIAQNDNLFNERSKNIIIIQGRKDKNVKK